LEISSANEIAALSSQVLIQAFRNRDGHLRKQVASIPISRLNPAELLLAARQSAHSEDSYRM
jgi:hypothetical protein